jgi:N-acetylmuramoyl-L-alanine amidase
MGYGFSRSCNTRTVSLSLITNNRGTSFRDDIAVIKPWVSPMPAVLIETARISGRDEQILHSAGSDAYVADGVKQALDWRFFGQ